MKTNPIYPTLDSLPAVLALADSKIPIINKNDLYVLLMIFQNTLIQAIKEKHV